MIKKRTRPQPRIRERELSPEINEANVIPENEEEAKLPLTDLIELRKLRRGREGIDVTKLHKGDAKKKKRAREEVEELRKGGGRDEDDDEMEDLTAKTRRAIRANNFTQQTNALDVDKHMMAYIEENLKIRSRPREDESAERGPEDPQESLYMLSEKWKLEHSKHSKPLQEGSVTTSMSMLTAIPEVDLGMDARLKNIEETEKAKRVVAEERQERKKPVNNGEEHLVATRFYRPNLKAKSDADILRDAKLEAMGLLPHDDMPKKSHYDKPQMATDELVMERFKKRMRK
ncbi:hypothetical protein AX15_007257 [Amanita polypyramis BW_CC]|nr:hypothetical protein AX15_007257 [Amanita polypyramis BW_CC]